MKDNLKPLHFYIGFCHTIPWMSHNNIYIYIYIYVCIYVCMCIYIYIYIYIYIPSLLGSPHRAPLGCHRAPGWVPCLLASCFAHGSRYMSMLNLPLSSSPAVSTSPFSTSVSIHSLKIDSSVHFSRFHIYALIYDICFSLSTYFTLYNRL